MRKIRVIKTIERVALALLAAALAAPILVDLAYRERGYVAFGGEWLAIILIMVVAYLLVRKDKPKEDEEKSEG